MPSCKWREPGTVKQRPRRTSCYTFFNDKVSADPEVGRVHFSMKLRKWPRVFVGQQLTKIVEPWSPTRENKAHLGPFLRRWKGKGFHDTAVGSSHVDPSVFPRERNEIAGDCLWPTLKWVEYATKSRYGYRTRYARSIRKVRSILYIYLLFLFWHYVYACMTMRVMSRTNLYPRNVVH